MGPVGHFENSLRALAKCVLLSDEAGPPFSLLPLLMCALSPPVGETDEVHLQAAAVQAEGS